MISSKIKFLAFEGGGGKGVAYLGAIKALEEKGILPISNDNRKILGISGSSTGAITALMLSLHMSKNEIEKELKNKNFEEFYTKDEPQNSIFRAVYTPREKSENPLKPGRYEDRETIKVGYGVDIIIMQKKPAYKDSKKEEDLDRYIWPAGKLCSDLDIAKKESEIVISKNNTLLVKKNKLAFLVKVSPDSAISKIQNAAIQSEKIKKSDDTMLKQILADAKLFPKYIYNILYDRGVFPGFNPREYFSSLITKVMKEKFQCDIDGSTLNFRDFFEITEVDIRISGANISNQIPVYFSKNDTPDFPVSEAVGMAMSMPMIFKPVYVDAVVHKFKNDDYQKKYRGFYVDAGTIRNFPLHAFDDEGIDPEKLNKSILAFQLTSGAENVNEFDTNNKLIIADKKLSGYYKAFEEEYKAKFGQELNYSKIHPFQFGNINKFKVDNIVGTSFLEFAGKLFDSIMYYTEEGQIRDEIEREQVINLYTYHIFTRDFNPINGLRDFVQEKAYIKTKKMIL